MPLKASKIPFVPAKTPTIYIGGINGGIGISGSQRGSGRVEDTGSED